MTHNAIMVGASSGIGEELARQLHRSGWLLGLPARRTDRLTALAAEPVQTSTPLRSGCFDAQENSRLI